MDKKRIALIQNGSDYGMQEYVLGTICDRLNADKYEAIVLPFQYYDDNGEFRDFVCEKIEKPDYDLVITMDLTGFERRILEDETFYNQLYCPMIHLITKDAWYFSHYLGQRLNFSMFFYHYWQYNVDYVKETFWKFPNMEKIPAGGFGDGKGKSFSEREIEVYYPTSYERPDVLWQRIEELPEVFRNIAKELCRRMEQSEFLSLYGEVKRYFEELSFTCSEDEFVDIMTELSVVTNYVKMHYVDSCTRIMLQNGIHLAVSGKGWEKFVPENGQKPEILGGIDFPYQEMLKTMQNSKIVFSNQIHKGKELHERVLNAALNGAIALTDTEGTDEAEFFKRNIVTYSNLAISEIPEKIKKILSASTEEDDRRRQTISDCDIDEYQISSAVLKMVESSLS